MKNTRERRKIKKQKIEEYRKRLAQKELEKIKTKRNLIFDDVNKADDNDKTEIKINFTKDNKRKAIRKNQPEIKKCFTKIISKIKRYSK